MMPLSESKKSHSKPSQTGQTAAGSQTNGQETGLAQHIWKRYDHASGFTIRRFQLAFAQRHPLASNLRLPLLSAVQKRWGSAEDSYSGRPAVSAYTWRSGLAYFPDASSRPRSMRVKSQPGHDDPADKEWVRPTGENKELTARRETRKTLPGAEADELQARMGRQRVKSPGEAGIIRRVGPTISAGEKVLTTDPLQTGMIDQQGREHPGGGQLSNSKSSHTYDLLVAVSPAPRTGRMEAPILQRRKKPAARHDSKLAAASQTQVRPQDNRTAGTGSQSDFRASAKTSPTTGILRKATGNLGTAIIQRIQHRPGIQRKLSAAGPVQMQGNRESIRRHRSGQPISTVKGSDAVAMQKKIFGNTDNAKVSYLPTTVKSQTDSRQQSMNRPAGQHVLAPVNGVGSSHPDGSATVSGGSGLMAPATGATIVVSKDPAEENRRQFVIKTETGNSLAAGILQRHGRILAGGFIRAKMDQAANLARFESDKISATDERIADHPSVPSLPQAHPAVTAFAENRALPQMMIHRTFTTTGAAGSTGSGSSATEYTLNTCLRRTVDRHLAMLGGSTHGFEAMNMNPKADRFAHSTASDPTSRPVVQLFASDRPLSAGGRSMRSSEVQSGDVLDAESRPLEPRGGISENETAGSIELEQLVEKVLHKLMRRIAVEKERRGLQRWP